MTKRRTFLALSALTASLFPLKAALGQSTSETTGSADFPFVQTRYLLNSPMFPQFKRDADGGITFYIQHKSPGADQEANWLPSPPSMPFNLTIRVYQPKKSLLDGTYKIPPVKKLVG
jgi:hypothetical protein